MPNPSNDSYPYDSVNSDEPITSCTLLQIVSSQHPENMTTGRKMFFVTVRFKVGGLMNGRRSSRFQSHWTSSCGRRPARSRIQQRRLQVPNPLLKCFFSLCQFSELCPERFVLGCILGWGCTILTKPSILGFKSFDATFK